MENASKALLIAGGVLIAILVASLGVYFSRNIADYTSRIYKQLEESERTKFNQQFLNYDGKNDLTIQDIVTIVNLAKDSNKNHRFEDSDSPDDPLNDYSLYITVSIIGYDLGSIDPSVPYITATAGMNLEKIESNEINEIINNEMTKDPIRKFKCEVNINKNTKYVNYIKITP